MQNIKQNRIENYNKTQGAVDTFDQMCEQNNCCRKTKRWPLYLSCGIVNAAIITSSVIYKPNMTPDARTNLKRKNCM